MVKHVVMWKVKGEGGEKEENVSLIVRELLALKDKVPAILSIEAGKNFSSSPRAFDVALVVTVEDREKLDAYRNHPEHRRVAELIGELTLSVAVVDFEI